MRPGTRPKPTRLKLMAGNPGKRPLNKHEPQPSLLPSLPDPPKHLAREGRKEWIRVGGFLLRTRVLTEADLTALSAYATVYGRWNQAELEIKRKGILVPPTPGSKSKVQNPMLAVANKALQQMVQLLGEFGLTPSTRTRIVAADASQTAEEMKKAERYFGPHPIRPTPAR